jgi:hypothetical protein
MSMSNLIKINIHFTHVKRTRINLFFHIHVGWWRDRKKRKKKEQDNYKMDAYSSLRKVREKYLL